MTSTLPGSSYDVIVIGSGVAGLSTALGLAGHRRVALVTAGPLGGGSTRWAQGGIAAAIGADDTPALHAADTLTAGVGVCDERTVERLTVDAPNRLAELIGLGAEFDRNADGVLDLTREGGHHRRRVAHAGGDATGAEVSRALVAAVQRSSIQVIDNTTVLDLLCAKGKPGGRVTGVVLDDVSQPVLSARAVVLATGGVGGIYLASTNPAEVAGDGIALALRAGASLVDMEFVQFHPTALRTGATNGQIPLITEALRGEGALLLDTTGRRIMAGHHAMADLAPRDIVARRIDAVMAERLDGPQGANSLENSVFLDATGFEPGIMRDRFPTVYDACRRHGIDPEVQPIPVAPAQHFLCGGVRTDCWGRTDVAGLFAVGEVAATGVHGANRLASNSLLEGLVFGRRLASRLNRELPERASGGSIVIPAPAVAADSIPLIRATMTSEVGVRRSGGSLETAWKSLAALTNTGDDASLSAANRWQVAASIVAGASAREESRGCHWRDDYPETNDGWRRHVTVRLGDDGVPYASSAGYAADGKLERSA